MSQNEDLIEAREDRAIADWQKLVDAELGQPGVKSRADAVHAVATAHPELRESYVAAFNARRRRAQAMQERGRQLARAGS